MAIKHWREVPIVECGQPLVRVTGPRLITRSAYVDLGYQQALPDVWLRREVAAAVNAAARLLPPDLGLLLWDGWRPVGLQGELYDRYRDDIARQTGLTGAELEAETQRFVSLPCTDEDKPSPHLTGGSIDLTLVELETGLTLPMGGEFDELTDRSRADYYERAGLTDEELAYRDRRRLLAAVMTHAGFSQYPEEWWHFDRGNQFGHHRVGGPARYGPVLELPTPVRKSLREVAP